MRFYLAFARSTTPIHGNEGLRVTPKSWKKLQFYLALARSTTPIHGIRVARHAEKLQLYLAFARSTMPIHGKGCIPDRWRRCWFRLWKERFKYRDVDKPDADNSMYFTLMYFTLCTMHLILCTSLDVLQSDVLHSVYYALDSMHSDVLHSVYYALDSMHFTRCTSL